MCTAISVRVGDGYFGRNLDYESEFGERVVVVPRNYSFSFNYLKEIKSHYAIIGMAVVENEYPLFFDAVNEAGLGMAGLRFAGNAVYKKSMEGKENVASFEFISWILAKCKSAEEAEVLLKNANITDDAFSGEMPSAPLHWIIADRKRAITVEQTAGGLKVYDNPAGVLTNNPEFYIQMQNLTNYMHISSEETKNRFSKKLDLVPYSRGMGALGLPGDLSSASRFVKTSFICENSIYGCNENDIVNHFFHTLYAVYQQKGCVRIGDEFEITNYSSCVNLDKGIYYYTTYNNSNINAVDMHRENLDGSKVIESSLIKEQKVNIQN